jgi:phage tail-like protein
MSDDNLLFPLHVFRFHVDFKEDQIKTDKVGTEIISLCSGAFQECTGLEATMEPKVIKEGGRNYGAVQRAGPVSFATVILKRGMTTSRHLWKWFELVNSNSAYAYRLAAFINMYNSTGEAVLAWKLEKAMPIKFKASDLNAKGTDVGVEELHLAHEGITLVGPTRPKLV